MKTPNTAELVVLSMFNLVVIAFTMPANVDNIQQESELKLENAMTAQQIQTGYIEVNLTTPFEIFGQGKFDKLFINTVGAVSFGSPLRTSVLSKTRKDVIILAPLLLDTTSLKPEQNINFGVVGDEERKQVEADLRVAMKDEEIVVDRAFAVRFNFTFQNSVDSLAQNNAFQVVITSGGGETYVTFKYDSVDVFAVGDTYGRAGLFAVRDGAIQCTHEIEQSGTAAMSDVTNSTNVGLPGQLYWRGDLPLECRNFRSDCGKVKEVPENFDLCPVGSFFETLTDEKWRFYRFYFCTAGRTLANGLVTVKQECRYDPDYYSYEWRSLSEAERCSKRIKDFWANFHRTSSIFG